MEPEQTENRRYLRPDVKPDCIIAIFEDGFSIMMCRNEAQVVTPFGRRFIVKEGARPMLGLDPDLIVGAEAYEAAFEEMVKAWKLAITGVATMSEVSIRLALRSIGIAIDSKPIALLPAQY